MIELMVTIAVVGVLMTLAAPGFLEFVRGQQSTAAVNRFVAALNSARSEAIGRSLPTALCPSSNPNAAAPNCTGGNNWGEGWIVFTDAVGTNAGRFEPGAGEQLLRVGPELEDATLTSDTGLTWVGFRPSGIARQSSAFTLTPDINNPGPYTRQVTLTPTGRARVPERFQ